MDLQKLQRVTVDALEDIKAHDIKVFDTLGQSSEFDRVIVATGNSNRQTRALAWSVVQKVKENGGRVVSVEGTDTGEWVLVDLGDVVVHIMQPTIRQYYGLEELWGAKPVRLKAPAAKRTRTASADALLEKPAARNVRAKPAGNAKSSGGPVKKSGTGVAKKNARAALAKSPGKSPVKSPVKSRVKSPVKSMVKSMARPATAAKNKARKIANKTAPTQSRAAASRSAKAAPAKGGAAKKRASATRGAAARPAKKA